jgi:hypothetical protein
MILKDVRAKLNVINKTVEEHLDFLLEIRQDEQLYKDDIDEIGEMADDVLSTLTKHSDLLRSPAGGEKDWVCEKCGKSTFETDYDYLVHPKLHLGCALEGDEYGQVSQVYNRGIANKEEPNEEEQMENFAEELRTVDSGHQPS